MKIEDYLNTLPESILSGQNVQLSTETFKEIFNFVNLRNDDVFYHLGCGDGTGLVVAREEFTAKKVIGIDNSQEKIDTAKKMESALDSLKPYGREFESPYRDPFDSRLIFNRRFSPLLTDIGKYQSKATVLKPNFAALVINEFTKAGLEAGDTVAISMTGSMPGANIAVLMACETMNLHYVSISSLGASEWGATDTTLSWPKMEKIL